MFNDPLHDCNQEGGESPNSGVIRSFGVVRVNFRVRSGVVPQLGDCAAVHGSLEQDLKHAP